VKPIISAILVSGAEIGTHWSGFAGADYFKVKNIRLEFIAPAGSRRADSGRGLAVRFGHPGPGNDSAAEAAPRVISVILV